MGTVYVKGHRSRGHQVKSYLRRAGKIHKFTLSYSTEISSKNHRSVLAKNLRSAVRKIRETGNVKKVYKATIFDLEGKNFLLLLGERSELRSRQIVKSRNF